MTEEYAGMLRNKTTEDELLYTPNYNRHIIPSVEE